MPPSSARGGGPLRRCENSTTSISAKRAPDSHKRTADHAFPGRRSPAAVRGAIDSRREGRGNEAIICCKAGSGRSAYLARSVAAARADFRSEQSWVLDQAAGQEALSPKVRRRNYAQAFTGCLEQAHMRRDPFFTSRLV